MKSIRCVLEMLIDASSSTPDERAAARGVVAEAFPEKKTANADKAKTTERK